MAARGVQSKEKLDYLTSVKQAKEVLDALGSKSFLVGEISQGGVHTVLEIEVGGKAPRQHRGAKDLVE